MDMNHPHRRVWRLLALLVALADVCAGVLATSPAGSAHSVATRRATIDYVVDGDTLRVRLPSGATPYVRLIGIDSPEDVKPDYPVECGARAASASMRRLAPEGASVELRSDFVGSRFDRYGRILAHAYVDRRQLEVAQLRNGWAYFDRPRTRGAPAQASDQESQRRLERPASS